MIGSDWIRLLSAIFQRRHEPLRIDAAELRLRWSPRRKCTETLLIVEPFQVERDTHAERGGRAEIAVELHARARR